MSVKSITALAANKLGKFLAKDFRRVFGPAHDEVAERLGSLARSTIECLGRSDALYHNYEHTDAAITSIARSCSPSGALENHQLSTFCVLPRRLRGRAFRLQG